MEAMEFAALSRRTPDSGVCQHSGSAFSERNGFLARALFTHHFILDNSLAVRLDGGRDENVDISNTINDVIKSLPFPDCLNSLKQPYYSVTTMVLPRQQCIANCNKAAKHTTIGNADNAWSRGPISNAR
jgi:hypothetical protein